jgi:S1-C subfamily serine protease
VRKQGWTRRGLRGRHSGRNRFVILLYVPKTSDAAKADRLAGGILLAFNGKPVRELQDLLKERRQVVAGTAVSVTVLRYQQESTAMILLKP